MSNKYIKLSANQQQFSNSLNHIDFTIPQGYTVDLSKSKLLINCQPGLTQPTAGADDDGLASVFEVAMAVVDDAAVPIAPATSAVLVKNCAMRSQKVGVIESLRRVDTLRSAQANYSKDVDEKRSLYLNGLNGPISAGGSKASPFVNYVKTGTTLSTQITESNVSIPLHECMDVCSATSYSTDRYGSTSLHFEMNFDKLQIVSLNTKEADGDGTAITAAVSDKATNNPESDFPFYTGQRVLITCTINGGAATKSRRIASITYSSTTGLSTINFATIGTLANTQTCVFTSIAPAPTTAPTYTISNCELELKLTDEDPPAEIQYATYSTEEDSFTAVGTKVKMYQVEPEADNLLVAVTNGDIYADSIPTGYRFRVDNIEQSRGKVVTASRGEHQDNINKLFLNMDLELKDISEKALSQLKSVNKTNDAAFSMGLIGVPLPVTSNQKNVNLEIDSAAMSELILYKRMVKSI